MNIHLKLLKMKTFKTILILLAIVATYTLSAQVAITDDGGEAHSSAMLEVKSTDKGFLPPRMTEAQRDAIANPAAGLIIYQTDVNPGLYQYYGTTWAPVSETADGSETAVTAGANVTVTGTGTAANPYVVNAGGATTYSVGDFAHGGIVFFVEPCGTKGLVCAKEDQSAGVRWYAGTYGSTQAKGDGIYAGQANTSIIIAAQVAIGDDGDTYAARICNELQVTEGGVTYGDWYLPSIQELNLMYINKTAINNTATANGGSAFTSEWYWSSTESEIQHAWAQRFSDAIQSWTLKFYPFSHVRAIRAF
jgi:hypothetical protein